MKSDLAKRVRGDFPLLRTSIDGRRIVYLDSAATSLKPQPVIDAICRYYTEVGANIHRGKHFLSEQASDDYEEARTRVARFTGFLSSEVVFTANTTASLNMVASGLGLTGDDVVLVPFDAHHSAMLPWRRAAGVRYIPVSDTGVADLDAYAALLRARPAVVVLTHCSNVSGVYAPVERMAAMAKEAGAVTVVDAAQSAGHRRVGGENVDFLAFSAHKMLGPTGVGVLCGRHELLRRLAPPFLGGGVVDWVDTERYDVRKVPHALEAGTPPIAGVYGLAAAIDYLQAIGFDELGEHDRELAGAMVEETLARPRLRLLGPADGTDRAAIASFAIDGVHNLKEIAKILSDSYGVLCRTGHMCAQPFVDRFTDDEVLRVSGYLYNDREDLDVLFSALDSVLDFVRGRR
ncbi:cysteine desulfurase SufS [Sphaerisporangium krabiense]|uniref:cysteine desulfurase n=1 Tax=Sphaerisporangium krabiense TaxID=763782 RepID=A0A7W8Z2F5_9ACTN|nr:aminotransferase class V-fold PLP-dependent enzyme [Sphaerisporangium krabiense]MBB5626223.1 cysteine desulfurase/selenocysteine lyase [Sphaerisporangium krabiense]GII66110.1 cysteine desulfurase SufS [Sphaerisporangium krabiense]